ncbi:hypothetical protein N1851_000502 [Merluccius polli]|uniref:CxC3 like cysteine cluster domain-containing protein n=1 Tax=Merluccius polli TaxID=89951 RepID=A0AA47NCZ7_MERPO|nr:hypothetical protein N1851_000502 [Merluccius polli]
MKIRCTKSGRVSAKSLNVVALPPKKRKRKRAEGFKVTWRKRDRNGNIIPQHVRKNRSALWSSQELRNYTLMTFLKRSQILILRDLLSSVNVPAPTEVDETPTMSAWTQRQLAAQKNAKLPTLWSVAWTGHDLWFFQTYSSHILSDDRPKWSTIDQSGQHQLAEQVCVLPIPAPLQVCSCGTDQDFTIVPGKQTVLVTINDTGQIVNIVLFSGPYNLCLPVVCCPVCEYKWTPGINDLLGCRYWPATTSCQLLFKFDVFTSFEEMKLASPALSQQAFLRMLEHRSLSTGRMGSICRDNFHRAFREFAFCNFKKDDLCQVEPFKCPACTPDMLAISADGNRKHYRFKKSKGTGEPSLFDGLFIAQDAKVSAFVDQIRSQMTVRTGHDVCGPATFTAARETSQKSRAKVDEEGLEIAVCRHGILLQGLNHYRGEIYAYPLFLQKELAETANVTFFCMDITCRYWPYMEKMAEKLPELQPLTEMKPFLSVMHAKAHTGKCEVRWGGRNQEGAGNTIGEEVEQVNSFLSRADLATKYMTKSGRADMITVLAMGWNRRKVESLDKTLAKRFVKTTQRADLEAANLLNLKQELNISQEDTEQWVEDVKKWAATDSNKTRQRKRRRLTEAKKKLQERIMQYNDDAAFEERIDIDVACSLSEDLILPWDVQGDVVSLRLKRRLFDQVMLVRRMEEERLIIVKEMTQHCHYLRKALDKLNHLLHHMDEDIKNHMSSAKITEEGYRGLQCCLLHKRHLLQKKLSTVTSTYALVDTSSSFTLPLDEGKEEGEEKEEEESEEDDS